MDKLIFWAVDHYWLITITIGIIALIFGIIALASAKRCPDCLNIWVPKKAKVCQKCGYQFTADQPDGIIANTDHFSKSKTLQQTDDKPNRKHFSSREDYKKWRDEQLKNTLTKKD